MPSDHPSRRQLLTGLPAAVAAASAQNTAGAAKPNITTPAALKKTLLASKSITYAENGASRKYILQMFDKFKITDAMKAKTVAAQGSDASNAQVADGSAEMILTLISEILPAKGVQLAGPLPKDVQH